MVSHVYVLEWNMLARSRRGGNIAGGERPAGGRTRVQRTARAAQKQAGIHGAVLAEQTSRGSGQAMQRV